VFASSGNIYRLHIITAFKQLRENPISDFILGQAPPDFLREG
jgi:hypothetical protein